MKKNLKFIVAGVTTSIALHLAILLLSVVFVPPVFYLIFVSVVTEGIAIGAILGGIFIFLNGFWLDDYKNPIVKLYNNEEAMGQIESYALSFITTTVLFVMVWVGFLPLETQKMFISEDVQVTTFSLVGIMPVVVGGFCGLISFMIMLIFGALYWIGEKIYKGIKSLIPQKAEI